MLFGMAMFATAGFLAIVTGVYLYGAEPAWSADIAPSKSVMEFCAAEKNNDNPGRDYYGTSFNFSLIPKPVAASGAGSWRCMDGRVWVCNRGADGYLCQKMNASLKPIEAMTEFCRSNPGADFIPMYAIGNSSSTWRCLGAAPAPLATQVLDKRQFIKSAWRPLAQ
jgi:hypothetical protein